MKHVLFSDVHLGVHNNNEIWLDTSIKFFQEITDFASRKNCSSLICLGDFFHNRKEINVKTLDYAYKIVDLLRDFNTYIIIGNHDTFYKDSLHPSSLQIFEKYPWINVIDELTEINNKITLVPWETDFSPAKTPILMGHFEINGFNLNNHFKFYGSGNDKLDFTNFDMVFSGHFHTPSKKDNIRYLGSAYPQTFNDVNSARGYYLFDDEDFSLEFYEFTSAPKYINLYSDEEIKRDKIEGNVVKLIYKEELSITENSKLIDLISSYEPISLTTDFSLINTDEESDIKIEDMEVKNNQELLFEYIDKLEFPDHIKKPTLKKMISNLT